MNKLIKKISLISMMIIMGGFFLIPSFVFAGQFKDKLTSADWIILQIPIPFPGCSNTALKNYVKCCDDLDIKNFYIEKNSSLSQTYKSYAPICPSGNVAAVKDIPAFILVVVQFLTIVVIIMMVLFLMISGIQYVTSMGNPEQAAKSIDRVKRAAFGLVVVLFSSVILYQVNPDLLTLSIDKPEGVNPASLIEHCPEEGTVNCGEPIKNSYCQGRKCQLNFYCAETKKDDVVESLSCKSKLELGKSCVINDECLSSLCAQEANDPAKKICTDVKALLAKDCETNNDCKGLFCYKPTLQRGQCTFGNIGNLCSEDGQCNENLGYKCINDRCTIPAPYGKCDESKQCPAGYLCEEGSYYNTLAGTFWGNDNDVSTCLPPSASNPSESTEVFACNNNNDCKASPFGTSYCAGANETIWVEDYCTLGLVGSPCTANNECATKYCYPFANICTNGATGDSCLTDAQCSSGYCFKNISGKSNYCLDKPGSAATPAPALRSQPQQ